MDLRTYCRSYFARLCRGYSESLDHTLIRAWLAGHKNPSDDGGCVDMSSRMFPALAAWLGDSSRPKVISCRGTRIDLEAHARAIMERAFDPAAEGFWGMEEFPRVHQYTVESSVIAYGLWLLRDSLPRTLDDHRVGLIRRWLDYFSPPGPSRNNWALFWIVNQSVRKALGWDHSQEAIDGHWALIESLDRGDGWSTDGPEGHFDDYNWWVFTTHEIWWMQLDGESHPERYQRVSARIRRRMEDYPYFFGADGSYSEYGRSLSYKFARLGGAIMAYRMGLWPHSTGMLKRLVRLHLQHYDNLGAIDRRTDVVRQELSEFGHPDICDSYINTGHPYWCMHAFTALWQLADDDPFWTADEEPLPVEKTDFSRTIRPAGWIVQGEKSTGQVIRYALGSRHGTGASAAKYAKFMYSSHLPVNFGAAEGEFGPDCALCLSDGRCWLHPQAYDRFAATDHSLRACHAISDGQTRFDLETILVPRGPWCVRVHRINTQRAQGWRLIEGGAPVGYRPGELPRRTTDARGSIVLSGGTSGIWTISGYRGPLLPGGFRGREDLNAIHYRAIFPQLEAVLGPDGQHQMACITLTSGKRFDLSIAPITVPDIVVDWRRDNSVRVVWDGQSVEIAPLAP